MLRVLGPMEARHKLGQIIEEACWTGEQFIITRRGKPMSRPDYRRAAEKSERLLLWQARSRLDFFTECSIMYLRWASP
ncbi:MAG TPA: hypothetical protein DEA73_08945 [Peptococcaceae bacterium]|nr:hypothetical protein [Peptococcaceae bacterium]